MKNVLLANTSIIADLLTNLVVDHVNAADGTLRIAVSSVVEVEYRTHSD